jgi:hypothetical protein
MRLERTYLPSAVRDRREVDMPLRRVGRPGLLGTVSRLQQLAQLKDSGVLSEKEFQKAKGKLLAG